MIDWLEVVLEVLRLARLTQYDPRFANDTPTAARWILDNIEHLDWSITTPRSGKVRRGAGMAYTSEQRALT